MAEKIIHKPKEMEVLTLDEVKRILTIAEYYRYGEDLDNKRSLVNQLNNLAV
jgi:ubiquitin